MNKFIKIIVLFLLITIIFSGGFISGKLLYNKPTREIKVGYEKSDQQGVIEIRNVITDVNNQDKIDYIQQVLTFAKQINSKKLDLGKPDLHLIINSPKEGIRLTETQIWFTDDGAIIDLGDYRKISLSEAKMLKKMVGYKEL
ncbi:hypothetical protein [Gottfriedia acidiceleris]|uniref:hypothetical protein n=1 Tax=Gottfriedia acidiceleris TaxID=371036 RepID=UPI00101C9F6F|nr:hypothetical protein [Gottfriedia acidiceleris]